jgi:hypothetical protein
MVWKHYKYKRNRKAIDMIPSSLELQPSLTANVTLKMCVALSCRSSDRRRRGVVFVSALSFGSFSLRL